MSTIEGPEHLRVLIANQRATRLDHVTAIVISLGHEVIARSIEVEDVAAITARERPDVALVGLGDSSTHALDLIDQIVRGATCPVIALLETDDHTFINEAAKRGIFAYITDSDPASSNLRSTSSSAASPNSKIWKVHSDAAR